MPFKSILKNELNLYMINFCAQRSAIEIIHDELTQQNFIINKKF